MNTIKTKNDIKIGIIGTNFVHDWFCDAAKLCGIVPTAVFSRKEETGKDFAKKHSIENVFCDFDEFCESSVINCAYVASPNICHFEQTKKLLLSGKHIICEKPVCSNLNEYDTLLELARKNGLVFIEAMRPAYDIATEKIKELIARCGKLRYCHFEYSQYSSRYDKFKDGIQTNAFNPALSNAAVMDIGVYPLHMCILLFGKPEIVLSRSVMLESGFEGMGNVILGYSDKTCEIAYSKITESCGYSFIRGEKAELRFGKAPSKITEITLVKNDGTKIPTGFCPAGNNMIYEITAFCDFILGKRDSAPYVAATRSTMEVLDTIRRQNNIVFPADLVKN